MPEPRKTPLYGLVLAGGRSRRMGRDKALLQNRGRSQLAHVFELLDRRSDATFVSIRRDQLGDDERARFPVVVDRYDDMGPIAGILSAMEAYPAADWLVMACDLPNVGASTLDYLVRHEATDRPFTAFRSSHDGLPEPLCSIMSGASVDIIREFVDAGVVCPRKIMIRSDTALLEQPDPAALDNVNTPDDLANSSLEAVR